MVYIQIETMPKLEFSMDLSSPMEKLVVIATNYENYEKLLSPQVKSVKIIEKTENGTLTEEVFHFSSLFSYDIVQKSFHKKIQENKLETEIITGPFKGTVLQVSFSGVDSMTKVSVFADVKIQLKYKVLTPVIKKYYRTVLMGLLYKMDNIASQS